MRGLALVVAFGLGLLRFGRGLAVGARRHRLLQQFPWPGNVRELRNTIERGVILSRGESIEPSHLPEVLRRPQAAPGAAPSLTVPVGTTVEEAEKALIFQTLDFTGQNKTRAAEILGISLKTLHNKLNRYRSAESA